MSVPLQSFYEAIQKFLLESGLETEQSLHGHSDDEIASAEQYWGFKFPKAYSLFLKFMGKSTRCFNDQGWGIEVLSLAKELSQEVAERNQMDLDNWFPFTERQWYSFYSFKHGSVEIENPEIMLVVEGDEGVEIYNYPSFTGWLMTKFDNYLNLRVSLKMPQASKQQEQFEILKLTL